MLTLEINGSQRSLDGVDAARHDSIRGAGNFERTLEGVRRLCARGLLPIVTATETSDEDPARYRERLLALGAGAVLIKGGHGSGTESVDFLIQPTGCTRLAAARIATANTHGTGCTLSSAVAAGLAKGLDLREAVRVAKSYVSEALAAADRITIGSGHGPVHHFYAWW